MSIAESKDLEKTLGKPQIHANWENLYRTSENEKFYEMVFDYVANVLKAPENSLILDAGCGAGAHAMRLARRGFSVVAADFSDSVLEMAKANLQAAGMQDQIRLQHENLLSLSFPDETFDAILVWGVLMHIPDVEKAVAELTRVLKKGGSLIVSEGNMYSLQSVAERTRCRLTGKHYAIGKYTDAGLEYWETTPTGQLLTRVMNIGWLKKKFIDSGFTVQRHVSGQFSERYTRYSSERAKKLIHDFNRLWFRVIKFPQPAFGNLLILRKKT